MKNALLFGSTGFIGSHLLSELLASPQYERVTVVVRKDPGTRHPKLKTLVGDFSSLPRLKSELIGDDVFIALGTTKKKIPDQQEYYKVDHDYPVLAAKLAMANGAKSVLMVTAVGANADSKVFYVRTKGEVERDVIALGYAHTHIFRPSMLLGTRVEHRPLEKTLIGLWSKLNPVLGGGLSRYKGIDGFDVARAMMAAATSENSAKVQIYEWNEMHQLADGAKSL